MLRELKESLNEIFTRKELLWLFIVVIIAYFFIMPVAALFLLMTINHFNGGTYQMSIVEMAWGTGMLAGGGFQASKNLP